jgi:uncharacterized protein (DUF362 family)
MTGKKQENLSRREFIARSAKAGASIAAAAGLAYWLYQDNVIPRQEGDSAVFPDFSVAPQPGKSLSIVQGTERKSTVIKAIDMLGGIEHFVKPGDVVLIKPNIAFASSAALGATTNPELLATIVRLCYDRGGAKKVIVTDNPINDPDSCFALTGIGKAASAAGAQIMLPKDSYFSPMTIKNAQLIKSWPVLYEPLKNVNKVIGIAPLKDHHRSGASMTMKNWYGLLGGRRNIFHQKIHTIITELAMMIKPTLVILDAFSVMKANGPTGGSMSDLYSANTIIAGTDQVAVDSFGAGFLNLKPADLPYLTQSQQMGLGTTDYQSLKPLKVQL